MSTAQMNLADFQLLQQPFPVPPLPSEPPTPQSVHRILSTPSRATSPLNSNATSPPASSPPPPTNTSGGSERPSALTQMMNQSLATQTIAAQLQQLQQLQFQQQQLQMQLLHSHKQAPPESHPVHSAPTPIPHSAPPTPQPQTPLPTVPLSPLPALATQSLSSPVYNAIQQQLLRHLVLLKQQAAAEERFAKNGIQKNVHVVVKNSPFVVQVGQNPQAQLPHFDLSRIAFECSLVYDSDVPDPQLSAQPLKYVDFVRVKPMEFKAVPSERGDQISVELRIKVLTSQHEDMFFRVLIQGLDPITRAPIANLRLYTEPIKVISKPEQIKKRISEETQISDTKTPRTISNPANTPALTPRKRSPNDSLMESMGRIEQQQQQHGKMLEQILELQQQASPAKRACTSPPPKCLEIDCDFASAFNGLLRSYSALDRDHRAIAVRQLMRSVNPTDLENLSEMIDMFSAEGLKKELGQAVPPPASTSLPILNCEFEEFCKDFATTQSYYF